MTTPTIDSTISGQSTGTIKIPDYYDVLNSIASTLATQPVSVSVVVASTVSGTVATTLMGLTGVTPGYFVKGEGIPAGTFITTMIAGTPNTINLSNTVTAGTNVTLTLMSPTVAQVQALGTLHNDISSLTTLLSTTGAKAYNPYDLVGKASSYAYYGEHPEELSTLVANLAKVPNNTLDSIKTALTPVTKL